MRARGTAIEDYALIGDMRTAALVGRDGSIDWLCLPRFDAPACFAALLGGEDNGRWRIAPDGPARAVRRDYRGDTLVLESRFETPDGAVRVVDFMPPGDGARHVVRVVEGVRGRVRMAMELRLRFDYGRSRPWQRRQDGACAAVAGPDAVWLRTRVDTRIEGSRMRADFHVSAGELVPFVLSWSPSYEPAPPAIDALRALAATQAFWEDWISGCAYAGEWRGPVVRSLLTLRALTYAPTGGIVAAPTTSLPEEPGGVRNWDYRYCWLRDASITLMALTRAGFGEEAGAWHSWLLRAVAGDPADLQVVYGLAGERRLPELELSWLAGYEGSAPVRIGNEAAAQFQLDVYGEVVNAIHLARRSGLVLGREVWDLERALVEFVAARWRAPDEGIWEVRGPRRHFVLSKAMAWVAVDRALRDAADFGLSAPVERWRALRREIHREVCELGYDPVRRAFTQSYGSERLDASALLLPILGFLPPTDPRVQGTVAAIERELTSDAFVLRYETSDAASAVDGLPRGEGAFLACSFWLVGNHALAGRVGRARALFERLLAVRNDVGLLAEEYDPRAGRQLGNFPQAFSHVPLVMAALVLDEASRRRRRHDAGARPGRVSPGRPRSASQAAGPRPTARSRGAG